MLQASQVLLSPERIGVRRPFPKVYLSRWKWLEPYIERALAWLGASEAFTQERLVSVPASIDLSKGPAELLPAIKDAHRRNDAPVVILVGRDQYADALRAALPYAVYSSARIEDGDRLFNLPVIVVPTMEGVIVLPNSVAKLIR